MQDEQRPPINGFRAMWQLLGVLLLVGVLVAILLPVYMGSMPVARRAACHSNMKQVATGMIIYASDFDDTLPPYFTFDGTDSSEKFMSAILLYTKNKEIFLCADESKNVRDNGATNAQEGIVGKMDYVHSLTLRGAIPDYSLGGRQLKLTTLKDASLVPFMRDPIRGYGTDSKTKELGFLSPHGAGFATSFLDGHAKIRKPPDTNKEL